MIWGEEEYRDRVVMQEERGSMLMSFILRNEMTRGSLEMRDRGDIK